MSSQQRVALVTGANGALGGAVVAALDQRGYSVVGIDIVGDRFPSFDISTADGCQAMVDFTLEQHGRLDVLVLNAGAQHVSAIGDFGDADWRRVMAVNLDGPFYAIRSAWKALIAAPQGRVIAVASTSSLVAEPYKAAYIASKHGLFGLVKAAALEGAAHGLTVNAVAPTWMRTPMVETQLAEQVRLRDATEQEVLDGLLGRQPIKRFAETGEVASAIAYLASEEASAITGTCLPVDLGTLAS